MGEVVIQPGQDWRDTEGSLIEAHGGGLLHDEGTWWWYGEDKAAGHNGFAGINAYSSADLARWTPHGHALAPRPGGDLGPRTVGERPKVLRHPGTGRYVMWLHVDDRATYGTARVGVAVADRPEGPFAYRGDFAPLGMQSRDMTVFQDLDGAAYLVFSSASADGRPNARMAIARLDDDYLGVAELVHRFPENQYREAPALAHVGGRYHLLTSFTSGWSPNPVCWATAPSLAGPWTDWRPLVEDSATTYRTQPTHLLEVAGTHGTTHVYCADRWVGEALEESRYVWLPLRLGGLRPELAWHDRWFLDAGRGTWRPEGSDTGAHVPAAGAGVELLDGARIQPTLSGVPCVRGLAGGASVRLPVDSPHAGPVTLRVGYVNETTRLLTGRLAAPGGGECLARFPSTEGAVRTVDVTLPLARGRVVLSFGGPDGGGAAPDLAYLSVQAAQPPQPVQSSDR